MTERKSKVDRSHDLPVSRQCNILAISRSSAYRAPAGTSRDNLELMRNLDALHMKYPFKGTRRLRDDLWDMYSKQVNRKRVQRLMRLMRVHFSLTNLVINFITGGWQLIKHYRFDGVQVVIRFPCKNITVAAAIARLT